MLGNGNVLEFDTPQVLLSDMNSQFCSLVQQTGIAEAEHLRMLANIVKSEVKHNARKDNENEFDDALHNDNENDPLIG